MERIDVLPDMERITYELIIALEAAARLAGMENDVCKERLKLFPIVQNVCYLNRCSAGMEINNTFSTLLRVAA